MGSNSVEITWDGKLTQEQVRKKFAQLLSDDRHEHGHGGYSGSWGTMTGVTFPGKTFQSYEAAMRYCLDNTSKWDNAMAVRYTHVTRTLTKEPTFNGKALQGSSRSWGAVAYYRDYQHGKSFLTFADQVSALDRERITKMEDAASAALRYYHTAKQELDDLIDLIKKPPTAGDHADVIVPLPVRRETFFRAQKSAADTSSELKAFHDKLIADLYAYSESSEQRWLIAGWAAS